MATKKKVKKIRRAPRGVKAPESHAYWRANKRLIVILLAVWALVSLGLGLAWAGALNAYKILGVPAGFFMAQQGAIYIFILLIWIYARRMDQLDHGHGVREREGDR